MGEALVEIGLSELRVHERNSNVMGAKRFEKLVRHIGKSGRYPPLIVRAMPGEAGAWQVLDGHHRWRALERLGVERARCVVWEVDDEEALVLLATLNRLEGSDDPLKRAALVRELVEKMGAGDVGKALPDGGAEVERLLAMGETAPEPRGAVEMERMRVSVHFFLLPEERRRLEGVLRKLGGGRDAALMAMVEAMDDGSDG